MKTNCIVNIIKNETFTTQIESQDCPEVVLLDFEDQSLSVINSSSKWVWLLIASLIGCVGINLAGKILIMWYVNCRSIPRPMNVMILIDQVISIEECQLDYFYFKESTFFQKAKICLIYFRDSKLFLSWSMEQLPLATS